MRKQFYLDLVARLKAAVYTIPEDENGDPVTDEEGDPIHNPKIMHADLWNRQIEFLEKERPFKFPAVFIEFLPIEYRQLGLKAQEADVSFKLHVVSKHLGSTSDGASYQDAALAHLDLLDEIHYALSGWSTSYSGPMVRTGSVPNHDHAEIIAETETYRACMTDLSGVKRVVEVEEVTPVFTTHLHKRI
jgi:hypothetical protein